MSFFARAARQRVPNPQAFGTRWRAARAKNDIGTLVKMGHANEIPRRSTRAIAGLARDLVELPAFDEALALLPAAYERHPSDYWLIRHLGYVPSAISRVSGNKGLLDDSVRYLTAALAVRGNNAEILEVLSFVLGAQGRKEEMMQAARAAV